MWKKEGNAAKCIIDFGSCFLLNSRLDRSRGCASGKPMPTLWTVYTPTQSHFTCKACALLAVAVPELLLHRSAKVLLLVAIKQCLVQIVALSQRLPPAPLAQDPILLGTPGLLSRTVPISFFAPPPNCPEAIPFPCKNKCAETNSPYSTEMNKSAVFVRK